MAEIKIMPAYDFSEEIGELFSEYTQMLIDGDPKFKVYLDMQNYDDELKHLENKYGLPGGRLYIAYYDDEPAGCVAMKKADEQNGEMKRLYVRPEFRNKGIGKRLVQKIIDDARDIGYSYVRLDTLPFLQEAFNMYKKFEFYEIPEYNDSPMDRSIYMRKELR